MQADGCAIWGSHSGASTTGNSSDDVISIGSRISQVAAASIFRDWVVQETWASSSSNMASHRGRLEASTLIDVGEQRLRLLAHDRTIWRAWAVAGSDYRDLPESYGSCFCYYLTMLQAGSTVGALYHKLWTQSSAPEDGQNYHSKHVELIVIINKICYCCI